MSHLNERRGVLATLFGWWTARRAELSRRAALREMAERSDHALADVGLLRAEVEWALDLPMSQNAAAALARRSTARRESERSVPTGGWPAGLAAPAPSTATPSDATSRARLRPAPPRMRSFPVEWQRWSAAGASA